MKQLRLSPPIFATTLLLLLSTNSPSFAYAESEFTVCKAVAGNVAIPTETSCSEADGASIARLQSMGLDLSQKFNFENKLSVGVESQLNTVIAKYDRWAKCEGACTDLDTSLATLPKIQRAMRFELALMEPDDLTSGAIQTPRGWFTVKPKHPFSKSPELAFLTSTENGEVKAEFFRRLAKHDPSIASRIDAIQSGTELIGRDSLQINRIEKAILKVRAEARQNYLRLIGTNPLLIFLDDHGQPLDRRAIAEASAKLSNETLHEKTRLAGIQDPKEKAEALIEYKAVAETVLKQNPRYCVAAEKLAVASEASRKSKALALAVGQVAAGFAAATFCGTVIACGIGAAIVTSADFGIAAYDAQNAFRSGVASAAISGAVGDRDVGQAMANADTAASMQGAILAMGLPTVLKSGVDIVRASASALRGAAVKTAPVIVKGGLLNEVVGGAPPSKLNPFFQSFYKDVLESHQGREREIIETLIERLQAKGMKPDKISTTIKDRIRQCVR